MHIKKNKTREYRINMKAVIDAYSSKERALGWYCYLENELEFPFWARCIAKRKISPLMDGEIAKVIGMPPEKDCMYEIFVMISLDGRRMAVPLIQLRPLRVSPKISQAVRDWHYWVARGYEF